MLLYERLSNDIKDACFEVHAILGTGLLEKCYERALAHELELRGIKCKSQSPIEVRYKNRMIGSYFADLVVSEKIILEIKCVNNLSDEHLAQTIHYLKATDFSLALLVNFGCKELEFKRVLRIWCRKSKIQNLICTTYCKRGGSKGTTTFC